MNKIQYIELLKLRGVSTLLPGESIAAALERTGGKPTLSEMVTVNEAAMNYYIQKSEKQDAEITILTSESKANQSSLKLLDALIAAGVDSWSGYEEAQQIVFSENY